VTGFLTMHKPLVKLDFDLDPKDPDVYKKINEFDFDSRAVVYLLYQSEFVTITIRRRARGAKWCLSIEYRGEAQKIVLGLKNPSISTEAFDFESEIHLDELFDSREDALLSFTEAWPALNEKLEKLHNQIRKQQLHLGYNWKQWP
jgi:hypothetical protein